MATKKKITKGRDKKTGRFLKGNEVAVIWTVETIVPELEKILAVLGSDDSGDHSNNIVRANDIKYAEEAVMCAGVDLRAWEYWNETEFKKTIPEESPVLGLIKRIKKICELRLSYAGQVMDIFHLKNHYKYVDKTEQDITTGGDKINKEIDYSKLSTKELLMLKEINKKCAVQ